VSDELARHRRGERALAGRDELDRSDDLARGRVLEQEAVGAGAQRPQHQLVAVEGGEHEHPRRARLRADERRGGDAVELGHPQVHEHDVGMMEVHLGEDLAAVRGLPHHLETVPGRQHHAQPRAHQCIVIHDEHADAAAHGASGRMADSR
jgi:hypothetical protein